MLPPKEFFASGASILYSVRGIWTAHHMEPEASNDMDTNYGV